MEKKAQIADDHVVADKISAQLDHVHEESVPQRVVGQIGEHGTYARTFHDKQTGVEADEHVGMLKQTSVLEMSAGGGHGRAVVGNGAIDASGERDAIAAEIDLVGQPALVDAGRGQTARGEWRLGRPPAEVLGAATVRGQVGVRHVLAQVGG